MPINCGKQPVWWVIHNPRGQNFGYFWLPPPSWSHLLNKAYVIKLSFCKPPSPLNHSSGLWKNPEHWAWYTITRKTVPHGLFVFSRGTKGASCVPALPSRGGGVFRGRVFEYTHPLINLHISHSILTLAQRQDIISKNVTVMTPHNHPPIRGGHRSNFFSKKWFAAELERKQIFGDLGAKSWGRDWGELVYL